jgi:hypothetical protein
MASRFRTSSSTNSTVRPVRAAIVSGGVVKLAPVFGLMRLTHVFANDGMDPLAAGAADGMYTSGR